MATHYCSLRMCRLATASEPIGGLVGEAPVGLSAALLKVTSLMPGVRRYQAKVCLCSRPGKAVCSDQLADGRTDPPVAPMLKPAWG